MIYLKLIIKYIVCNINQINAISFKTNFLSKALIIFKTNNFFIGIIFILIHIFFHHN